MCDDCKAVDATVTSFRDQFVAGLREAGISPEQASFAAWSLRHAAKGLADVVPDQKARVHVGAVLSALREIATDYDDAAKRLA